MAPKIAGAGRAAGGFIKKMVGDLIRPAERIGARGARDAAQAGTRDATRAATKDATKAASHDAERSAAHKVPMRDADGKPLPTKDLKHPHDDLLDRDALDRSYNRQNEAGAAKERSAEGDTPSVGRDDPKVRELTDGYHPDGGGSVEGWPDSKSNPDGFADPDAREPAVLQPGEQIDRFGHNFGQYTSPVGEPYAARALPESNLDAGYRQFEVQKPLPVWRGEAAPAQHQLGGATQHYLPYPVVDLVKGGYLKQIYPPVLS